MPPSSAQQYSPSDRFWAPVANRGSRPAAPYPGQTVYVRENNVTEVSDGTAWFPIARGGVATYGPAGPGWPRQTTMPASALMTINKLTVPAVPYARSLFVTAQAMLHTSRSPEWDRFDLFLVNGLTTWGIDVYTPPDLAQLNSRSLVAVVPQAANVPVVLDLNLRRVAGSGVAIAGYHLPYTSINVLAIPS